MTVTLDNPAAVMNRLAEIEQELDEKQNDYEQSAGDKARLIRDWEKRLAIARVTAKGRDADTRKAAALMVAAEQDDLYDRLTEAEGTYAACHAAIRVLEAKVSIGQSILKAQGRA